MLHARRDYMRIQDPAGLIPENEPVFLIRGKDVTAPSVVSYWADKAEEAGADQVIVDAARNQAIAMILYQSSSIRCHIPDMNSEDDIAKEQFAQQSPDLVEILKVKQQKRSELERTLKTKLKEFCKILTDVIKKNQESNLSSPIPMILDKEVFGKTDVDVDCIRELGYVVYPNNITNFTHWEAIPKDK